MNMNVNITVLIISFILLIGCSERVIYKDVARPVLVCPEPPTLQQPDLYISKLSSADVTDFGKVSQYYVISINQLKTHIKNLENILNRYNKVSESYKELNTEFEIMYGISGIVKDHKNQ